MKPYGIISDTHNYNFSAFAGTDEEGLNTRLLATLAEWKRCAQTVHELGGDTVFHAGDTFHVRGSVAPTVLNPTKETLAHCHERWGTKWEIDPGNHDMEFKVSSKVGNAVEALACEWVNVRHFPTLVEAPAHRVLMIPWIPDIAALKEELESRTDRAGLDVIIHAPVDGVIHGLPPHGLTAGYLASLGFRRVFAGHYHHHKDLGNGVYSVGAIAHHTWSDVGTKAGFLIVSDEGVRWHASHAPSFVDIHGDMPEDEIALAVDGNYVRAKVRTGKMKEVNELREWLTKECNAAGVTIEVVKEPARTREGAIASVKAGASLEASIAEYVRAKGLANGEEVARECQKTLAEVA